ncbi:histidine kinase [Actinokineospora sp. NBRC 105648]|uniref:sensor histidine kinase n=1 Tax=Actinokineospora sp. NBRC 105648 TaxID=3032206 RepID=UPI0024A2199F|nr:histidine kinase [Actinokineospora sp. NBRC 105648]GLZ37259.1 two-component sensor histidine kinase [Actinokineospora sp. NBRC 105648]
MRRDWIARWADRCAAVGYAVVLGGLQFADSGPHATFRLSPGGIAAAVAQIGPLGVVCSVLPAVAVALRGRWPLVAAALVAVAVLPPWPGSFGWALVLYSTAAARRLPIAAAVLAVAVTGVLVRDSSAGAAVPVLVMVLGWVVGLAIGRHRAYTAERVHRAFAEAEQARAAANAQRLSIARDLHDVVAHSMSVITVQAGYAHLVIDGRPEHARAALGVIETTGRETLVEMRRLLGVLRESPGTETDPPGLANLSPLLDRTARAGVRVDVQVTGSLEVPAGLGVSAYRIVQEALTNVVKHADTQSCRLSIVAGERELRVEVEDQGAGAGPVIAGHGLTGMRERLAAHGGTLRAEPVPGGGFLVTARFPVEDDR